ncbi:hypothetical protein DKX15_17985, partial [Enterococcus faecium]
LAHDLDPRVGRDAPAADELDRDPAPLHLRRALRPGAVDDAALVLLGERQDLSRDTAGDRAADLDDQTAHER